MNAGRRQMLIGLAGAALYAASGCALLSRGSELENAIADLEAFLAGIDAADDDRLVAIAGRIGEQSRSLLDAHNQFARDFNDAAVDRSVTDEALARLAKDYDADRIALRNQLLASQDELKQALPDEAWPDVLELLNKKQLAIVPGRAGEA